jgi:hypothetical protein
MRRTLLLLIALLSLALTLTPSLTPAALPALEAGLAETDVTPEIKPDRPVWLGGFGHGRAATGVHDPLRARAVVLASGETKIAMVCVDVIGLFHATAERVRARLPSFTHIVVSSTHNHEGPDTMGLWGRTPFQSGIDADYLAHVEDRIVEAVKAADKARRSVTAKVGSVLAPELLRDSREPYVKHDELTALLLRDAGDGHEVGIVMNWHCHPETLESKNTLVSTDFVGPTVETLKKKHRCPIVYLSGSVGGMMTTLRLPVKSADGKVLPEGSFEKTTRYGELLAEATERALKDARPARLTPLVARSRIVYLPLTNKLYLLAHQLGVLKRDAYVWTGDSEKATVAKIVEAGKEYAIRTEIGFLRLGDLEIAVIPGEIYPELVLGKVQDPVDPGADFPDAPIEPSIYAQMAGPHRMLIGLGSDELGYIIPKRQWDEKAPFCYGRTKAQYGEMNSLGPETAPLLCKTFQKLVKDAK